MKTFKVGEPFMPHYSICGFRPADEVGKLKDLRDGPKRLYALLVRRAGKHIDCWPGFRSLSDDLGKSERQVRNDLYSLMDYGLIIVKQRGLGRSNSYRFLFHDVFLVASDRQCASDQERQSGADRIPEVGTPEDNTVLEPLPANATRSQSADAARDSLRSVIQRRSGHTVSEAQIDSIIVRATVRAGRPVNASECAAVASVLPLPTGRAQAIQSAQWWVSAIANAYQEDRVAAENFRPENYIPSPASEESESRWAELMDEVCPLV